jgi:hypothetical protein
MEDELSILQQTYSIHDNKISPIAGQTCMWRVEKPPLSSRVSEWNKLTVRGHTPALSGAIPSLLLLTTTTTNPKEPQKRPLHTFHRLLLKLLLLRRHIIQPLLPLLPNLLINQLIVLLAPLPNLIPQHLPLGQRRRIDPINCWLALDAEERADTPTNAAFGLLLALLGETGFELLAEKFLALGEFGGDVGAFKGAEDLADVVEAHGGDVFEEGDELNEGLVVRVAGPWGEDDGVIGLVFGVAGHRVDHDDFGEIAIQIGEVLKMAG